MKYNGYLIYTDLDATLLDKNARLSDKNKKAIENFQKNGGFFSYATGRSFDFTKKFPLKANAPLICVGGTRVYDCKTGEEIFSVPMDKTGKDAVLCAKENYKNILAAYVFKDDGRTECDIKSAADISDQIFKVVFVFETEDEALEFQKDMAKRFEDSLVFERSWNTGVEMLSKYAGKGACVKKVRDLYKNKIHTIVCAGDFENDISMLRAADTAVAVSNALSCVKKEADIIAPAHYEDAIAWIIENIKEITGKGDSI